MASSYSVTPVPGTYVEFFGSPHTGFPFSQLHKYALTITESEDGSSRIEHLTFRFGADEFVTVEGLRLKLLLPLVRDHTLAYVAQSMPDEDNAPDTPWVNEIFFGPIPEQPSAAPRPVRMSLRELDDSNYRPLPDAPPPSRVVR